MRAGFGVLEEAGTFGWVVAKLVAKDTESIGGVTEACGDLGARKLLYKEGTQGLVLAMVSGVRGEKEPGITLNS